MKKLVFLTFILLAGLSSCTNDSAEIDQPNEEAETQETDESTLDDDNLTTLTLEVKDYYVNGKKVENSSGYEIPDNALVSYVESKTDETKEGVFFNDAHIFFSKEEFDAFIQKYEKEFNQEREGKSRAVLPFQEWTHYNIENITLKGGWPGGPNTPDDLPDRFPIERFGPYTLKNNVAYRINLGEQMNDNLKHVYVNFASLGKYKDIFGRTKGHRGFLDIYRDHNRKGGRIANYRSTKFHDGGLYYGTIKVDLKKSVTDEASSLYFSVK